MKKTKRLSTICLSVIAAAMLPSTAALACCFDMKPNCCCPTTCGLKDGFYLGAGVGYDNFRLHNNETTSLTAGGETFNLATSSPDISLHGWMGGLFAGYGMYFQNMYYLGAEIFGNDSSASNSHTFTDSIIGGTITSKLSMEQSYGASVLPGIKVNDNSLVYVRLGYTRARVKAQLDTTIADLADVPVFYSGSNNAWLNGFTYGLGIETLICGNFSLRGEYNHTNYNSTSNTFGVSTTILGLPASINSSTSATVRDNQAMLSLVYHIC